MVDARRLVAGVLLAAASAAGVAVGVAVQTAPAGATTAADASASTLYKDALATTHSWSVHYDSSSTESSETLVESGDAGPASASQTVTMGQGSISILVFGGTSYIKGNTDGLESLAGLSSSQASEAAGQWIEFSTDNTAFAPVVEGVRSTDIAKELALKAPAFPGKGTHTRRPGGRCHLRDPDLRQEGRARRPLRPRRGNPRSRRGGLGELQGTGDGRRTHHLLEVG